MFTSKAALLLGVAAGISSLTTANSSYFENKVLNAEFSKSPGDFQYIDDTFRNTVQPKYADGLYESEQGAVCVVLGGFDFDDLWDMSGAWKSTFQLDEEADVQVMVEYAMYLSSGIDNGDDLDAMVSIDGNLVGVDAQRDFVDQLKGEDGDVEQSTGYKTATLSAGRLSAGEHEILIGGFLLTKDAPDEVGKVCYRTVMVTTGIFPPVAGGADEPTVAPTPFATYEPTVGPTTEKETEPITTAAPQPNPTPVPSSSPTAEPTTGPTTGPTTAPSSSPTAEPTSNPTPNPTSRPTPNPTPNPTSRPTPNPTPNPTSRPTPSPTPNPTSRPTPNPTPAPVRPPVGATTVGGKIINANFDTNTDGFTYMDDPFFRTRNGAYTSGRHTNGGLGLWLGGKDDRKVTGMSAGWMRQFTLTRSASVRLMFDVQIWLSEGPESNEFVRALATVNGKNLISLMLRGGSGRKTTTGKRTFTLNIGVLPAGSHKLILGAFMNEKTASNEQADLRYDNVMLSVINQPVQPPVRPPVGSGTTTANSKVVDANFQTSTDGFYYSDNVLVRSNGHYASGDFWRKDGGMLAIKLGGRDNHTVYNMNGGWIDNFYVRQAGSYQLSLRFKIYSSGQEEPGEYAKAIVVVDRKRYVLASINGVSAVVPQSVGWKTVKFDIGHLSVGNHKITLAGFAKLKTWSNEEWHVVYDDVCVELKSGGGSTPIVRPATSSSSTIISANFDTSTDHFVYRDDVFGGRGNGRYARGDHWKDGNGRKLAVILGGVDNHYIKGMSGAWQRKFRVPHSGHYSLTFRYMMYSSGHEEPGEYGQAIMSINGSRRTLAQINGLYEIRRVSTGWRVYSGRMYLHAGKDMTLSLGGLFGSKTLSNEMLTIVYDDLVLKK